MRALVCKDFAPYDQLKVEDVPEPELGEGMVMIEVKAAGVNFPDILLVEGKYQMKPPTPFVPGMEAAGVISKLGENVQGLEEGQRVLVATMLGAFAEKVPAHFSQVVPMPDSMSFEEGAALTTIYGTSYHALKDRAKLKEGETVLVLGAAGGVGIATVQLAKAMGAKVIAAASSDEKLAFARENGADETVNYTTEDLKTKVKELTGGKGVDVVYDPVGGDFAEPALRASGWDARYLVVGFAATSWACSGAPGWAESRAPTPRISKRSLISSRPERSSRKSPPATSWKTWARPSRTSLSAGSKARSS